MKSRYYFLMPKYAIILFSGILFICSSAIMKPEAKEKIQWLTVKEVSQKMKEEPRLVLIDLYTNWCYWCKVMDKKTYNNDKVIAYINKNFYAVKLNAESKETIEWENKKFIYNPGNKVNDFALYLSNGQLSFPTTVIFPQIDKDPAAIPGFMTPKEMESILKYFGEGLYKTQNYQEFSRTFTTSW